MNRKKPLVIFGTGDIGQLAHFYFTHDSGYEVVAFTADAEFITERECRGLPLVPFSEVERRYPPADVELFVALSYRQVNKVRAKKYGEAKRKGYRLPNYISSKSVVWPDLRIGDNCLILENQTIQPFVSIGSNVTLWSGNHIGHHAAIGDHVFVTSHVVVSGHVTIDPYCFLGVNATIRDGIHLAEETVVGAGAVVMKPTVRGGVYVGRPATRTADESSALPYFANTEYPR